MDKKTLCYSIHNFKVHQVPLCGGVLASNNCNELIA